MPTTTTHIIIADILHVYYNISHLHHKKVPIYYTNRDFFNYVVLYL